MSYSGCTRVVAFVPNLANAASTLTEIPTGVFPASAAYVQWLSSGCALIEGRLKALGYGVPVPSGTVIYDYVSDLEAQYAAYRAEQSRGSTRAGTGQRTRGDGFKQGFEDGLKALESMDLARMGMDHTSKLYIGGMEVSDKETDQGDTDMVQPRFARGAFDGDFAENTAAS